MTRQYEDLGLTAETQANFEQVASAEGLLPIKISPYYRGLVAEEVQAIGPGGPLYRAVLPSPERVTFRAPGEVPDFVGDKGNMEGTEDAVIQKYRDRALFLGTTVCFANCQYCFRTQLLSEEHAEGARIPGLDAKIETLRQLVSSDPNITEVILSGGDPLAMGPGNLERVFSAIRQVRSDIDFRVHSRAIAYSPRAFSDRTIELLGSYNVRLYHHITHPYEIRDGQTEVFKRLNAAGVRQYNQCPIIRGINDHPDVLKSLVRTLDDHRVRQVNFFIADPINYGADYRIPLRRLFDMINEVNWTTPSWVNSVRVVLDTPYGKVRREDIVSWGDDGTVVFSRQGHEITYHDLPEELYVPSRRETLLWQTAKS